MIRELRMDWSTACRGVPVCWHMALSLLMTEPRPCTLLPGTSIAAVCLTSRLRLQITPADYELTV